jgi:hypothetical protein
MKKIILALSLVSLGTIVSQAQGNVNFSNESTGPGSVVLNSGGTLSYASQFTVALYYGNVSGAATTAAIGTDPNGQLTYSQFLADQTTLGLTLATTAQPDAAAGAGFFNGNVTTLGVPGNVNDDLVIAAWTGNYSTLAAAEAAGSSGSTVFAGLIGFSNPLGAGGTSPVIPGLSGWTALTPSASDSAFQGAFPSGSDLIMNQVTAVPEPTTLAMAGVGLASMLIFRRKK